MVNDNNLRIHYLFFSILTLLIIFVILLVPAGGAPPYSLILFLPLLVNWILFLINKERIKHHYVQLVIVLVMAVYILEMNFIHFGLVPF